MIKTEQQIERDFYQFVSGSELGRMIAGRVYRSEMRPTNAQAEDIVVKLLSGMDDQVQMGVVILNIYVPDILVGGRKVINHNRVAELQEAVNNLIYNNNNVEYRMMSDGTPQTIQNTEIEQHFINVRIKFYRITN